MTHNIFCLSFRRWIMWMGKRSTKKYRWSKRRKKINEKKILTVLKWIVSVCQIEEEKKKRERRRIANVEKTIHKRTFRPYCHCGGIHHGWRHGENTINSANEAHRIEQRTNDILPPHANLISISKPYKLSWKIVITIKINYSKNLEEDTQPTYGLGFCLSIGRSMLAFFEI